ncbi:MAG: hypothetical protein WBV59_20720 [Anaerolineae bacterium]
MTPSVFQMSQANAAFQDVVLQAQRQRTPVLLLDDTGRALAWLEPLPAAAEIENKQHKALLAAHLWLLQASLRALTSPAATTDTLILCREQARTLYRVAQQEPATFRQLTLFLLMILQNITRLPLRPEQSLTLLDLLQLLSSTDTTAEDIRPLHARLNRDGLFADLDFDDSLLQQYLQES